MPQHGFFLPSKISPDVPPRENTRSEPKMNNASSPPNSKSAVRDDHVSLLGSETKQLSAHYMSVRRLSLTHIYLYKPRPSILKVSTPRSYIFFFSKFVTQNINVSFLFPGLENRIKQAHVGSKLLKPKPIWRHFWYSKITRSRKHV
jgi:hypothetical protein